MQVGRQRNERCGPSDLGILRGGLIELPLSCIDVEGKTTCAARFNANLPLALIGMHNWSRQQTSLCWEK